MAYTTINKHTDYFNTVTYTGDGNSGRTINVGFQPDFVWYKERGSTDYHTVFDALRGATKRIFPNATEAESTNSESLQSFVSNGYTVGNNSGTNANGDTYVSWNWKAGTTGSGTTNASKSYNYSVNTASGFSIIKYTGSGNSGHEIPHGLSATPKFIITKRLEDTQDWIVYSEAISGNYLKLNQNIASYSYTYITSTDSTKYTIGVGGNDINNVDETYIAYCFAEKPGYSKFGSYTGNGSTDGTFVYTGFKPAFIIRKRTDTTGSWVMQDNKRPGYNRVDAQTQIPTNNNVFYANDNIAEYYQNEGDILSNGFKIRSIDTFGNASGGTYIYMAFGQSLVGSNNVPCTAR